jgi:hypothetical protein
MGWNSLLVLGGGTTCQDRKNWKQVNLKSGRRWRVQFYTI